MKALGKVRDTSLLKRAMLVGILATLAGCSDKATIKTGPGSAETTSGAEVDDESDGLAKKMPASAATVTDAKAVDEAKAAVANDFRPKVPDAPLVQSAREPEAAPTGPSPWGASDAEAGAPLPPRPKLGKAALRALTQGKTAAARGEEGGAKAAFDKAFAADPRAYEAAYKLGVLADRAGQVNEALQYQSQALKIQPDYELAVEATVSILLRQGAPDRAVAYVQPIANQWERNLYLQAILAQTLIEANRVDDAEKAARKALRRDERFVPAMVALANASLRRGRLELADSILEQALTIDPNYAELHFLKGLREKQAGRLSQALASFSKAIELRPDYSAARMALGIQYMAAGNYVQAQAEFEAVERLVPTLVAVHLNLGDAYRTNRRWQDAKRELDKALRMQDNLPEAHYNMALMYMDAGAEFPGMTLIQSMQRAIAEFTTYREAMGPRLGKDDAATAYVADLQRRIERENKRVEREAAQKKRDAERAARKAEMEGAKP